MPLYFVPSTGVSSGAPHRLVPMPPPHSVKPLPTVWIAPFSIALTNSSTEAGFFTPLAVLSLYTNQLPGGSIVGRFEMPAPSQIMGPVGTTGSGTARSSRAAAGFEDG